MTPLSSSRCPSCDSPLPPDGLCVACLLAAGAGLALTPEPEDAPRSFGEYELIAEIGRGGMGRVFRARHRRLQREAAVKVVAGGDLASREFVERFHTEMLAAAALQHPHIVALHEAGECEGSLFLAMALVSGGSLHEVMHSGRRFTPREAAALVAPLAHAVHHGHQGGVLHRDIKPGNILLDTAGVPYLTDFGLARLMEHDSTLTRTNALLGTPAYMAPEQARGETATTAVDVYGLGAVLYELLTGRPPFAGGTTMETVRLLLEKAPEPPSRFAAVERDLEKVTLKCLAKNPADRYASADALAHDLEAWREGRPVTARLPGAPELVWKWMRRRPLLASALGIAALAVLTAGVVTAVFSRKLEHAHGLSQELAEQRRSEVARLYADE